MLAIKPPPTFTPSTRCVHNRRSLTVQRPRQVTACYGHRIDRMYTAEEKAVLDVNQKLLNAIAAGDYPTYQELCDPGLTCFEPEAVGNQVEGMAFHKFYFDNLNFAPVNSEKPHVLNTMASPSVHLMGNGTAAVVSYIRLTQKMVNGAPVTARAEETRVWEKKDGKWVHVHFHKSVPSS